MWPTNLQDQRDYGYQRTSKINLNMKLGSAVCLADIAALMLLSTLPCCTGSPPVPEADAAADGGGKVTRHARRPAARLAAAGTGPAANAEAWRRCRLRCPTSEPGRIRRTPRWVTHCTPNATGARNAPAGGICTGVEDPLSHAVQQGHSHPSPDCYI